VGNRMHLNRLQRPVSVLLLALVLVVTIVRIAAAARTPAAHPAPASPTSTRHLQARLAAAESAAEDVVRVALRGERAKVVAKARELDASARAASRLVTAPADERALLVGRANRVFALAAAAPLVRVALAANAVTALVPGLEAPFTGTVSAGVGALAYLDREAFLLSLAGQRPAVAAAVLDLARTWTELRSPVAARTPGLARRYGDHVAAMERLARRSPAGLRREAAHGLELARALRSALGR
jgi:hypothetical protein